jgi:hypothetical protein
MTNMLMKKVKILRVALKETALVNTTRADLIKLFLFNFTHTSHKLDHFMNANNICCIVMKRSSLQDRVSKLMRKKFYEIDPRLLTKTPD